MINYRNLLFVPLALSFTAWTPPQPQKVLERISSDKACVKVAEKGLRPLAHQQAGRFLGKVAEDTANCRGGNKALERRSSVWLDWPNYWGAGDASSKTQELGAITTLGKHLKPNERGADGALIDLEYQRMELIRFNLNDNKTFENYIKGNGTTDGSVLKTWEAMRLPPSHPQFKQMANAKGEQVCTGELIRNRSLTGICNDIYNPAMGSTNQLFARNVRFESTFPDLGKNDLARNRHGNRLGLLTPDPQVISRKLFTRAQTKPEACNFGQGLPDNSKTAQCDYKKAPFFNVLAAYWIQFMTHDWFSHLREGHNDEAKMAMGCTSQRVNNQEQPVTAEQAQALGCRPNDKVDVGYSAQQEPAPTFEHNGKSYLARAHKTTENTVTAWWDASQIYGFDDTSLKRVKRDPKDGAKLLMMPRGKQTGASENQGYLPVFNSCEKDQTGCVADPINPAWKGQEAAAFADNWTVGMSFYHNLFVREHNLLVDAFRTQAKATPQADSGLRNPAKPDEIITYQKVTDDELFQIARLVVAAEIAKIHTIEWTTQLLYDEPMNLGMNANWNGLLEKNNPVSNVLEKIVVNRLGKSPDEIKANQIYSAFAAGAGIFGLGSHRYQDRLGFLGYLPDKKDIWDLHNLEHVNGGINHFGSPFNFPEEFPTVYRLHPLIPDLLEFRELQNPNTITKKVPVVSTFRGKATQAMTDGGLSNWAMSMGRQRLGALTLQNHPQFLQNLEMPRLQTETNKIDIAALDLIRDREHGVPRFNEFRRQYGLTQLTGFDDFIDQRLGKDSTEQKEQKRLIGLLREVYGQHKCDASKVITDAQLNADGSAINDCLGHPNGSMVDNIEDMDTVVGWLAEFTHPHGFAISETQFHVFILNASRRLFSDRFFTSSFRPEFYSTLGHQWVMNNGLGEKQWEASEYNGHKVQVSLLKRIMLRTMPELSGQLAGVMNVFDPWARDKGQYYSLQWKPKPTAVSDESFK
ncbi:Animal heme peroxidase [Crenothrix polyspora]|uniref:Animal heme peroxidase n=1 Tax=Crenothrix polyspora TaxID=360316 RepID=A0A1R4H5F8_9GAMM|nr:peroxidase family protein [Crenothrix polyspora]SJM91508.1 Animal heme peroxidase [Crenothrix polyspora]